MWDSCVKQGAASMGRLLQSGCNFFPPPKCGKHLVNVQDMRSFYRSSCLKCKQHTCGAKTCLSSSQTLSLVSLASATVGCSL